MTKPAAISNREGWWSRDHALVIVLAVATALLLYVCWLVTRPFLGPLAWALALAVVAHPLHTWIASRIANQSLSAAVTVALIAIVIVTPAIFVVHSIVREAETGLKTIQATVQSGAWREQLTKHPQLSSALQALDQQASLGAQVQGIANDLAGRVSKIVTGSAYAVVELLLTFFVLFFFFRDRRDALGMLRSLVPLSNKEADEVFARAADTIHATIYGTLTVAAVQGTLGGLMFWFLGLPGPVLWGAVMGVLAVVPVLGAFVIWVPAAVLLAATGAWIKALILTLWGSLVIGLIDNLLYPILVGKRLRLHTLPVFIAVVGGLAVFGAVGVILGPLVLALTDAIIDIWRRRTTYGQTAEATLAHQKAEERSS
jgi:predicted PurR-regulated permease PerM